MNVEYIFGALAAASFIGFLVWFYGRGNAAGKMERRAEILKRNADAEKVKSDAMQKAAGTPTNTLRDRLRRRARKKRGVPD